MRRACSGAWSGQPRASGGRLPRAVAPSVGRGIAGARDEADFRRRLAAMNVDLVLRRSDSGRIYGATFIDHTSRTVLNAHGWARTSPPMPWKRVSTRRNPDWRKRCSHAWQHPRRNPVRTARCWAGCCPSSSRKQVLSPCIRACTNWTRRNAAAGTGGRTECSPDNIQPIFNYR